LGDIGIEINYNVVFGGRGMRVYFLNECEYKGFAFLPYWKWKKLFKPKFGVVQNNIQVELYAKICGSDRSKNIVLKELDNKTMKEEQ
jgi:hypothetical protein